MRYFNPTGRSGMRSIRCISPWHREALLLRVNHAFRFGEFCTCYEHRKAMLHRPAHLQHLCVELLVGAEHMRRILNEAQILMSQALTEPASNRRQSGLR